MNTVLVCRMTRGETTFESADLYSVFLVFFFVLCFHLGISFLPTPFNPLSILLLHSLSVSFLPILSSGLHAILPCSFPSLPLSLASLLYVSIPMFLSFSPSLALPTVFGSESVTVSELEERGNRRLTTGRRNLIVPVR